MHQYLTSFVRVLYTTQCLVLCTLLSIGIAQAEIYKVIDKDGNVSYTDKNPEGSNAENIQSQINEAEQRNISESPQAISEQLPEWLKESTEKQQQAQQEEKLEQAKIRRDLKEQWQQDYKQAKQKLKKAKKAKIAGAKIIDGDFIGKAGGGARPSEQYLNRQEALAQDVASATKALKQLKKNKPK